MLEVFASTKKLHHSRAQGFCQKCNSSIDPEKCNGPVQLGETEIFQLSQVESTKVGSRCATHGCAAFGLFRGLAGPSFCNAAL